MFTAKSKAGGIKYLNTINTTNNNNKDKNNNNKRNLNRNTRKIKKRIIKSKWIRFN